MKANDSLLLKNQRFFDILVKRQQETVGQKSS